MKLLPLINEKKCILCKKCIDICPKDVLAQEEDRIVTLAEECMLCSHCFDICPTGAISFDPSVLKEPSFSAFSYRAKVMEKKDLRPGDVVNLLRSRRSIRRYRDKEVPGEIIDDLVSCAVTAPSGSNCQNWEFTVINGKDRVWGLAQEIRKFFEKLNRIAANPLLRYGTVPFMGMALVRYYNNNYESVKLALEEADKGRDLLFHGAPAVVVVHGITDGSTPLEDGQYASYNMTILAHALGLGSCYIGYATEALNRVPDIRKYLGIPVTNRVYAVLVVGYPAVSFKRHSLRKPWKTVIR